MASPTHHHDEFRIEEANENLEETRDEETEIVDEDETQGINNTQDQSGVATEKPTKEKKKREKKDPVELTREPGKQLLPFSRVQKIIKADKDIAIVAKDATFLISLATEWFIKRLAESAQRTAARENRITIQHKDIATVVRKADEFLFLEEIIPWLAPEPPEKRKMPAGRDDDEETRPKTMLDDFVKKRKAERIPDHDGTSPIDDGDVIMNEDGTMLAPPSDLDDADDDVP